MNRKTCLVLLALALPLLLACFLTTCGGPRENCAESYDSRRTNLARICTDKEKYDFGEPIHITFTVTNISDEPLTLDGGDKPAIDIRAEGEYWSDERELTPELTRITLSPSESRAITWVWPTPQTDLDAVQRYFAISPDAPSISIRVDGLVKPWPDVLGGGTTVEAHYRWP